MLMANFFDNFFKYKNNNGNKIVKYNSSKTFDLEVQINNKIIEIDQKIAENSESLIQAQVIKLRSTFTKSNNFIERIGTNVYKKKLDESINWHQKEIQQLYLRRRELKINLEKIQGTFWQNRLKRFFRIIVLGFVIFFIIFIFLSGFMIIIYLLPLIILIFLGYLLATKKY
tara:strand:- start:212 stop:724 length:513 start_codon:yes stop_codon:yes gene_type:complete